MPQPQDCYFDHEKLGVYREAIDFVAWLAPLMEATYRTGDVKDQLDRAATSIPLNIAEGNGKYAPKDRCRFFDIAHGVPLDWIRSLPKASSRPSKFARARSACKGSSAC